VKTYYIPTGGVLHLGCTHGVVYYQSPLWWQESAQEHGDGLLSFKSPPTAFISDIPVHVKKSQKYTNILSDCHSLSSSPVCPVICTTLPRILLFLSRTHSPISHLFLVLSLSFSPVFTSLVLIPLCI